MDFRLAYQPIYMPLPSIGWVYSTSVQQEATFLAHNAAHTRGRSRPFPATSIYVTPAA
jgi:hypothetical protein